MATKKGFLLVFAILLAAAFVVASAEEITQAEKVPTADLQNGFGAPGFCRFGCCGEFYGRGRCRRCCDRADRIPKPPTYRAEAEVHN